jgi:hypothetical protein
MTKPYGGFRYDQFLTSLVMGLGNDEAAYGHTAVPSILHTDNSGLYPIVSRADMMRVMAQVRPRSSPAPRSGFNMETGNFKCIPYSYGHAIDKDDARRAKDPVDLDMAAAVHVAEQMRLINESMFAAAAFATTVWGTTDQAGVAGVPGANEFVRWHLDTATPGKNISALNSAMKKNTGKKGNTLFVSDDVDAAVRWCPDVLDKIKYTNANAISNGMVTDPVELAKYFNVKRYVVCAAAQNTAKEGQAASNSFFASNKVLLAYIDEGSTGLGSMSLANARFRPTALVAIRYDLPDGQNGKRLHAYYDEAIKSNVVDGDEEFVYHRPLIEAADNSGKNPLGQLMTAVIAA